MEALFWLAWMIGGFVGGGALGMKLNEDSMTSVVGLAMLGTLIAMLSMNAIRY